MKIHFLVNEGSTRLFNSCLYLNGEIENYTSDSHFPRIAKFNIRNPEQLTCKFWIDVLELFTVDPSVMGEHASIRLKERQ